MTYEETLDYIHSLERFGSKPGLERVTILLERLGNPQLGLRCVHIAGTNGKGSTAAMTASVLHAAGLRTGLYISPFVLEFRERIQLDGEMIPPDDLCRVVERVRAAAEGLDDHPTEFEIITAAALLWFAGQHCDIVVLEVGLGGRFDATNVIPAPLVAAITAIDLDHTQILGDTVEAIAAEKCGIIKAGSLAVSYPAQHPEALAVIMEHCATRGVPLRMGNLAGVQVLACTLEGSDIKVGEQALHIPLMGRHQIANCLTMLEIVGALRHCGMVVSDDAVAAGIAAVRFPSRLEILSRHPLILMDGAHNQAGVRTLAAAFELLPTGQSITAVGGMLADKDWQSSLACIAPQLRRLICVAPPNPRALPAGELAAEAARWCESIPCDDLAAAWRSARRYADEGPLLIWGSLYLAAEMRPLVRADCPS